ncbi:MAG: hypothetical protein ABFD96_11750 [Armatimonadia bacterium]
MRSGWVAWSVALGGLLFAALAAADAAEGPSETLRLRVTNSGGGRVEASADGGDTWHILGTVVIPADRVNPASFTAAMWAQDSAIAATATNAVHIKVANNRDTGRPMTLSLVPGGKTIGAAGRLRSSAIFTDIPGGESIFGGGLGPSVNSPVYVVRDGEQTSLSADYQPADGDVLLIIRYAPPSRPTYLVFENRVGGKVTVESPDEVTDCGLVDRTVDGIGRFEGAIYAAPGRIRANHPGVIDVSTSPLGMMGGFQIIPRHHATSPELAYVRTGHQWMVIGPADPTQPDFAGRFPFFSSLILPSYRSDDVLGDYADWMQRTLSRTIVQVRYDNGPWEPMPRIAFVSPGCADTGQASGRGRRGLWRIPGELNVLKPLSPETAAVANAALAGVTHIRIGLPQADFPVGK